MTELASRPDAELVAPPYLTKSDIDWLVEQGLPVDAPILAVLNHNGDSRTTWNPENQAEIDAAKETFNRLVGKKKYLAYRVKDDGTKGERIFEFDPTAGKIILSPQLQGG